MMMTTRNPDDVTAPVEDYLKVIYEIERLSGAAATTDIAHRLAIAPASVSGMVRRLAEQGLLAHERYRGVRLTDEGRRIALRMLLRTESSGVFARSFGYLGPLADERSASSTRLGSYRSLRRRRRRPLIPRRAVPTREV